jgi:hypothetical protein
MSEAREARSLRERVKRLERDADQQGYFIIVMMVILIVDTAAVGWLWQERGTPDFDHIAVALTVFQTLFGIAAIYGFWALRGLTRETAEETAKKEVAKIAPSLLGRNLEAGVQTFDDEDTISGTDVERLRDALDDEEE